MRREDLNRWLLYGALGVGGYVFVTKLLPDLRKGLSKGAGDVVSGAVTGTAEGAGTVAGSLIKAPAVVIDTILAQFGAPPDALERAGTAIGSGVFDLFHPNPLGDMLFYAVTFPDGRKHSIPSSQVDANGKFDLKDATGKLITYQMLRGPDGYHYASPI